MNVKGLKGNTEVTLTYNFRKQVPPLQPGRETEEVGFSEPRGWEKESYRHEDQTSEESHDPAPSRTSGGTTGLFVGAQTGGKLGPLGHSATTVRC